MHGANVQSSRYFFNPAPLIAQADNVRRVMREGKAFPETGLHIPVFDLLSIFAGHLGGNALYIVTDPDNAERWSDRILKPNESVSVLSGPGAQQMRKRPQPVGET